MQPKRAQKVSTNSYVNPSKGAFSFLKRWWEINCIEHKLSKLHVHYIYKRLTWTGWERYIVLTVWWKEWIDGSLIISCLCIGCNSVTYLLCLYGEDMLEFIGRPIPCSHGRFHVNLACLVHHLTVLIELLHETEIIKSVLNLQMTYIIIAHIYEQWDRWGSLMYHTQSKHA